MSGAVITGERTPNERRELLAQEVGQHVRQGYRVESQTDYQAIVVRGRRPNHLLHFIIGLVTLGFWWLFVWLPVAAFAGEKRRVLNVDAYGNVLVQKGRG